MREKESERLTPNTDSAIIRLVVVKHINCVLLDYPHTSINGIDYLFADHNSKDLFLPALCEVGTMLPLSVRDVHMIDECPICCIDLDSETDIEPLNEQEFKDEESARRVCVTTCGHMFHRRCLARCRQNNCPSSCREPL